MNLLLSRIVFLIVIIVVMIPTCVSFSAGYDKYFDMAMKYQKGGKINEADQVFSVGLSKYPRAVKLYYYRAKLRQHHMGNCRDAISDYNAVIQLNPRFNPKAFWRRGLCLYKYGQYDQAVKDYSNCLRLIPNYGRVYFLRAKAYAKLGMSVKAQKDLASAVKADPKYKNAANDLYLKIIQGSKDF